jgi:hypothetical protein
LDKLVKNTITAAYNLNRQLFFCVKCRFYLGKHKKKPTKGRKEFSDIEKMTKKE